MDKLKNFLGGLNNSDSKEDDGAVEVYADSVRQALELASLELEVDVDYLDYEIVKKGTSGFFGFYREPYHLIIRKLELNADHTDLDEIERKLSGDHLSTLDSKEKKHLDGIFTVRVLKSGIWLTVFPEKGNGKPIDATQVSNKLFSMRHTSADLKFVEKIVSEKTGEPVKIGDWTANPEYDSMMTAEITEDEMRAFAHFTPARYTGKHMELDEVLEILKNSGAVSGVQEKDIVKYLEEMDYSQPLLAAKGTLPYNGKDAYVDYKVRTESSSVKFKEDPDTDQVDFKELELLENVVIGQILAVKVPAEEGIPGRTITNKILPAKSGKDNAIKFGKGTILSEDGLELSAEINGQVVYKHGKISVEPVYVVGGDVSLETGNIVFLGSVIIHGSVQDNFSVKAAGNIEVKGTVQKAFLEAEGNILVRQGISGREEAKVESTGGSIIAKFIQNANIVAEDNVIVPEGILHSNVDAGEKIISLGRRARIVGGLIRAGSEVNARMLGAEVSTNTEIRVGINPKILQEIKELHNEIENLTEEHENNAPNLKNLSLQKKQGKLPEEKGALYAELVEQDEEFNERIEELKIEVEELNSYIDMLELNGKVCAEKSIYSGVDVYIKNEEFKIQDEYKNVKIFLEGGKVKIADYEAPADFDGQNKLQTVVPSRRR